MVLIFSITSHVVLFPNRSGRGLDSLEALLVAVVSPGIVNHTAKGLLQLLKLSPVENIGDWIESKVSLVTG